MYKKNHFDNRLGSMASDRDKLLKMDDIYLINIYEEGYLLF